jgi:N,N-dimethylformamidase
VREQVPVIGYCSQFSVAPGDRMAVHVSSSSSTEVAASLVRLSADPSAVEYVESGASGRYPVGEQTLPLGSYMFVPGGVPLPERPTISLWVRPTRPAAGRDQTLVGWGRAHRLYLDEVGRPCARWAAQEWIIDWPLLPNRWVRLELSVGGDVASLVAQVRDPVERTLTAGARAHAHRGGPVEGIFAIAASLSRSGAAGCYDGKIARPVVRDGDLTLGSWRMDADFGLASVPDDSPARRHGRLVNRPQKGMTGPDWKGTSSGWTESPREYDAISFHSDDLTDAGWTETLGFDVPADLPSGAYGVELIVDSGSDIVPFFVTPSAVNPSAPIALVLPTYTYLMYANERHWWTIEGVEELIGAAPEEAIDRFERWAYERGLISGYDVHSDGSGNAHVSSRRPLTNIRLGYVHPLLRSPHLLSADMLTIDWLRREGFSFDILTDHLLEEDGPGALSKYRAVLTGSHPEYASVRTLDAYERYLHTGGNVAHLGGNAFFAVISRYLDEPDVLEMRRGYFGVIPWQSEPGELRHASDGEPGGTWRWRGRSAHRLFGAGTAGVSFGGGSAYVRTDASRDPRYSWIFEGVSGSVIDAPSRTMGSPAAFEFDAMRIDLGTPEDAVMLAVASDFDEHATMPPEDVLSNGAKGRIESHLLYRDFVGGGRLFAAPSVAWTGCLVGTADNDVARVTRNVLRRFTSDSRAL